jgi:hypothetical protein
MEKNVALLETRSGQMGETPFDQRAGNAFPPVRRGHRQMVETR